MKKVLLVFALLLIIVAGMILAQNYLKNKTFFSLGKDPTITINEQTFELIVAKSPEEKEIGLSETKSLPENKGMIFSFDDPGYYSFWMKNMKIPIDIIYINNDEITTVLKNLHPHEDPEKSPIIYAPTEQSNMVLEINAGLSEKY